MGVFARRGNFRGRFTSQYFHEKNHGRCAHLALFVKIAKELTGPPLKPAMERLQNTEQEVSGGVFPALMYTRYIYVLRNFLILTKLPALSGNVIFRKNPDENEKDFRRDVFGHGKWPRISLLARKLVSG